MFCEKVFLYDSFISLLFGVFFYLIKPDEVGKPIANETSLQFRHNEKFSYLYFTLIDRKPTSFIITTMEDETTKSLLKIISWY